MAEACRRQGIDRTSYYEWKRRFQKRGFAGLTNLPPVHRNHPQTTSPETVARIKALALQHPAYGCNRLAAVLGAEGRQTSAVTVQKLLNHQSLGKRRQRWLALEKIIASCSVEPTPEQLVFLRKQDSSLRARYFARANHRDRWTSDQ